MNLKIINVKILFLFFLLLFFVNTSHSQFRIGISGELASASFGGTPPDSGSYQSIIGYGGNALIEYKLVKDLYLSFQPGFHKRGSKIKFGDEENLINDTVIIFDVSQDCFTFPLNLKIYNNNFYVGGGVILDVMTSANIKNENGTLDKDITKYFLDIDFMADFNLGYEFTIGKPSIFIELRYTQGLININRNENFSQGDIYKANYKSSAVSFLAGIMFPL
ncbi:MAG: PorT family protein [Bacteroidota bacterium]|nr:PorT family protein [Bacteroidota bacterium]